MQWIAYLGSRAADFIEDAGLYATFAAHSLWRGAQPPYAFSAFIDQLRFFGARSLLVLVFAGAFVGMVVALQFHDTLVRFGSVSMLGSAVGLSLVRELGPVLSGLLLIGRAGSAMCSEIGIMRSGQQIDALECMGIDPYQYLIAPRMLAAVVSTPLLTAIFVVAGIFGGWVVGVVLFGVSPGAYFQGMYDTVTVGDLLMGFNKSVAFGLGLAWICCAKGFFLHLDRQGAFGPVGVSRATTSAVVSASLALLLADYLISALMI